MAEKETAQKTKTVVATPPASQSLRAQKAPVPATPPATVTKPKTIVPTPVQAQRSNNGR